MVAEAANTTITLLRGTTFDSYGDVEDAAEPMVSGVPAILVETGRTVSDPATQTPRTVRSATCKIPSWLGALNTDQIQDETTGAVYAIEDITQPPSLISSPAGGAVDIVLTLRRVTAAGV